MWTNILFPLCFKSIYSNNSRNNAKIESKNQMLAANTK